MAGHGGDRPPAAGPPCRPDAGLAANQAAAAVTAAARAAGMVMPDPRVTAVARAAADVARGLVVNASAVDDLLRGCRGLVAA